MVFNKKNSVARTTEQEQLFFCQWLKLIITKLFKFIAWLFLIFFVLVLVIDAVTSYLVRDKIYTDVSTLPHREYALVLGTAKYYSKGVINQYYKYRLEAANTLYTNKKVDKLFVSGDNQTPYYNEPKVMTKDLHLMGVKNQAIKQDYAGYTTLDSILRAEMVYKLSPFTIVSQKFHCERALLIAKYRNIDAICYVAKYPEGAYQVRLREFLARTGMLFYLLIGKNPETLEDVKSQ